MKQFWLFYHRRRAQTHKAWAAAGGSKGRFFWACYTAAYHTSWNSYHLEQIKRLEK